MAQVVWTKMLDSDLVRAKKPVESRRKVGTREGQTIERRYKRHEAKNGVKSKQSAVHKVNDCNDKQGWNVI